MTLFQRGVEKLKDIRDVRCFNEITALVPEIGLYKKRTIRHVRRLAAEKGCKNLKSYYRLLCSDAGEREELRLNLTLKGTHFFRGDDWGFFAEQCLSTFTGKTGIKIWCAGCSSGEEAYSTIMALLDYVELDDIDVLATDYNDELLEKCAKADYAMLHLKEIPERYRAHLDIGEKRFSPKQGLRDVVHTENLNLLFDDYPAPFDVIVCRNVIKFFSMESIPMVQRKLARSLEPNGYLFLSTDDNDCGLELIKDCAGMGLSQIGERSIYQKSDHKLGAHT